jgi:hypothetical protein
MINFIRNKIIFIINSIKVAIIFIMLGFILLMISILLAVHPRLEKVIYSIGTGLMVGGISTVTYQFLMHKKILEYLGTFKNIFSQGISIYPNHKHEDIPKQSSLIAEKARKVVKVFTTTGASYFSDDSTFQKIKEKAKKDCKFRFLILDPDSEALKDRSRQDRDTIDYSTMRKKIGISIDRYLALKQEVGDNVQLRLYDCASAFQCFIVDDELMYVAPRIYGIKNTEDTPCIRISKNYPDNDIFMRYLDSFDEIWNYNSYETMQEFSEPQPKALFYYETWYTLNPTVGCSKGCMYCFLRHFNWGKKVHRISTPYGVVDALFKSPYYIPQKTVLCIGSRTEPFLPENTHDTLSVLKKLDENEVTNTICIITKMHIHDKLLEDLTNLKNIKPIFCVSYSALEKKYEHSRDKYIEDTLRNLKDTGFQIIHFWRPIINNVNSDEKIIKDTLSIVSKYCSSSVCVGLKVSKRHIENIQGDLSICLPKNLCFDSDFEIYFPDIIRDRIMNIVKKQHENYPVYIGLTSCAISNLKQIPDYLANIITYEQKCLNSNCPNNQRQLCNSIHPPDKCDVKMALQKINKSDVHFTIEGKYVMLNDTLSQEEAIFLYHQLGYPVRADKISFNSIWKRNTSQSPRE